MVIGFRALIVVLLVFFISKSAIAQKPVKEPFVNMEWVMDYKPFKVAGNLYYVGSYDLGCYLITTSEGHILINTGVAASLPMLQKHISSLGFKIQDIKILLTSQVHYDHVGAMAALKQLTGAQLMIQEADAQVMADGGETDYLFSEMAPLFAPVKPDRVLHDGDVLQLGGTSIKVLHHPGHTKGSCSYALTVQEGKKFYKVLIANMPSVIVEKKIPEVHSYPNMDRDYAYTFKAMRSLEFDLWLAAHASQFALHDKRTERAGCKPEVFRDQAGYIKKLDDLEAYFNKMRK